MKAKIYITIFSVVVLMVIGCTNENPLSTDTVVNETLADPQEVDEDYVVAQDSIVADSGSEVATGSRDVKKDRQEDTSEAAEVEVAETKATETERMELKVADNEITDGKTTDSITEKVITGASETEDTDSTASRKTEVQLQVGDLTVKEDEQNVSDAIITQISPDMVLELALPDLEVYDFSVNQNAVQVNESYFDYPFSVKIKNSGNTNVTGSFDLSFQTCDAQNQWGGQNQPGFNCIRIDQRPAAGAYTTHTGILRIMKYQISGHDLKVRAYVDAECSQEFPDAWGNVSEKNENNNYSNEVTLSGGYHPFIGSVTPDTAIKGSNAVFMIGGLGFGSSQGSHTVMLRNGTTKIAAQVTDWYNGVIYFTLPSNITIGLHKVTIADAATLEKCPTSNEVDLQVYGRKVLSWSDLIATWDLFNDAFSLELNTYGGGSSYENTSKITLLEPKEIPVDNIQFDYAAIEYRFLVNDFNSLPGGIVLTRQGCLPNQLKMEVSFESNDVELRGFNRSVLGGSWCDGCVADIHVNNATLTVIFSFSANGENIDFTIGTDFSGSISASNSFADGLMNAFLGDWNQDIRDQINDGVRNGLQDPTNKAYIASELTNLIRLLLGLTNKTITDIDFGSNGIQVTYRN